MKIKKIVNLTPHGVRLVYEEKVLEISPEPTPLRLESHSEVSGVLEYGDYQIPVFQVRFGAPNWVPPKEEGTIYIVSLLACQAFPDRDDFFVVAETIRDDKGVIIGAKGLSRNPYYK